MAYFDNIFEKYEYLILLFIDLAILPHVSGTHLLDLNHCTRAMSLSSARVQKASEHITQAYIA